MAKENETIADIIAEKRAQADRMEHEMAVAKECKEPTAHLTAQAIIDNTRREADRLEAAHRRERGDCAKLRKALKDIGRIVEQIRLLYSDYPIETHEIARKASAALAAPPRNCDVGTAEEQGKRYTAFCYKNRNAESCCGDCPAFNKQVLRGAACELTWAQMPYESEAAK